MHGPDAASTRALAIITPLKAASTSTLPLGACIGIAALRGGESYERLVDRADQALMQAKREGRSRFAVT